MKKTIIMAVMMMIALSGCVDKNKQKVLGIEEAKAKVLEYVNTNVMQQGQTATIKEAVDEGALYKMTLVMGPNQEIPAYVTKDGKNLFPQAIDLDEKKDAAGDAAKKQAATIADIPKNDKPVVELFVMSHCPYGTQIEKGILPVLETLGDKIDFELKFCDYVMHGEKEVDEQVNQYCIQKNEPEKLTDYLRCFLSESDNGPACLKSEKINSSKLKTCVAATDKEFKVKELFADKDTWKSGRYSQFNVHAEDNKKYGIGGSPNIVINGEKISSARDAAGLLKTICAGFENEPEECSSVLSAASPSPGFGFGTAAAGATNAGCGE
jgi:hypothetical protein